MADLIFAGKAGETWASTWVGFSLVYK